MIMDRLASCYCLPLLFCFSALESTPSWASGSSSWQCLSMEWEGDSSTSAKIGTGPPSSTKAKSRDSSRGKSSCPTTESAELEAVFPVDRWGQARGGAGEIARNEFGGGGAAAAGGFRWAVGGWGDLLLLGEDGYPRCGRSRRGRLRHSCVR
ncbi:hypothetical protein ACLOJK_038180 [Asimina triloba]